MQLQHFPKIGLRMQKTGLAVFLCLLLFPSEPFFACMTAVFCVQDTSNNSFKMAFIRGFGTLLGGSLGLGFLFICRSVKQNISVDYLSMISSYLIIAIGIITVIYILNLLKKQPCIPIACIVFLAVTTANAYKMPVYYTLNRIIETLFGIAIGLLVNHHIRPPKNFYLNPKE